MKVVHIYSTEIHEISLYVIQDSGMILCQMFAALLYVKKHNATLHTRLYWAK